MPKPKETFPAAGDNALGQVGAYVKRIEHLNEEKDGIAGDIKEVYIELKGNGLDPKVMRMLIAKRKRNQAKQKELEELLALYEESMGKAK